MAIFPRLPPIPEEELFEAYQRLIAANVQHEGALCMLMLPLDAIETGRISGVTAERDYETVDEIIKRMKKKHGMSRMQVTAEYRGLNDADPAHTAIDFVIPQAIDGNDSRLVELHWSNDGLHLRLPRFLLKSMLRAASGVPEAEITDVRYLEEIPPAI